MQEGSECRAVLIVEDEPLLLAEIMDGLTSFGFSVRGAGDAAQALDILAREPGFAAVVTDLMMPGMDGLAMIGRISEMPWEPGARPELILLTATLSPEDRQRAADAGVHLALEKPVRMRRLAEAVRSAADCWSARQPAARE